MLNENARAWVEALRSGDYTQTKRMLHRLSKERGSSFCCLGVACKLYIDSVGGEWYPHQDAWNEQAKFTDDEGASADSDLTLAVMDWLGLTNSDGAYCDADGKNSTLVGLNDDYDNFTFSQIADVIESEPKGLFNVE